MSYLKTRQALLTKLSNATIANISSGDIAFENNDFDPTGKASWLAVYLIPAITETQGKQAGSAQTKKGVFQVSVFTQSNTNYDIKQMQTIDSIISEFAFNTLASYSGYDVCIQESEVNNGTVQESWFKRDISINYLTTQ